MNSSGYLWNVRPQPARGGTSSLSADSDKMLLMLPYSGGSAQSFSGWKNCLPGRFRVAAASYPGHGSRGEEPFAAELDEIVRELFDALADFHGLLYIFGHSLGALVGFELSWRLQSLGRSPAVLFASSAPAPHRQRPYPFSPRTMPDHELLSLLESFDSLPEGIAEHPDLLSDVLALCRSDIALAHEYSFGDESRKLRVPIVAMGGTWDPLVSSEELGHWTELSTCGSTVRLFPGGHFYPLSCTAAVATFISTYIDDEAAQDSRQEAQNAH
jgi:surfactin synthase thioesterase subunit